MNTRKTRLNIFEFSLRLKIQNSLLNLAQIFVALLFAKNNVVLQASRGAQRIKRTTLLTF